MNTMVGDVLDNIFYAENRVSSYSYLVDWAVRRSTDHRYVDIGEIQSEIPAMAVFSPGSRWEAVKLDSPIFVWQPRAVSR
jgi:hypothetical protein